MFIMLKLNKSVQANFYPELSFDDLTMMQVTKDIMKQRLLKSLDCFLIVF